MLYECGCSQRVIDIPTVMFFIISDAELKSLCIQDYGTEVNDPFYESYLEMGDKVIEDTDEDEEDVSPDIDYTFINFED